MKFELLTPRDSFNEFGSMLSKTWNDLWNHNLLTEKFDNFFNGGEFFEKVDDNTYKYVKQLDENEMPGNFKINVKGDYLTISFKNKTDRGVSVGYSTISLPDDLDVETIEAEFDDETNEIVLTAAVIECKSTNN